MQAIPIVWVRPKQVAHWSFMRHFLQSVKGPGKMNVTEWATKNKRRPNARSPDVVKSINAWAETAMQGKDLVVNKGS